MLRAARNLRRLLGITLTLARHDALFPLDFVGWGAVAKAMTRLVARRSVPGRPGERLAAALQELGPSFIKLGQALSTRPDLIGETIARDLSELQDRLPPFPGAEARATVESELGAPIDELFSRFDDTPVAAASIAQVHLAVTGDDREVVVKVLRPEIEAAFARDLELFHWIAEMVERIQPAWQRFKPVEVVATFAATVRIEMDLRLEAAAAVELRKNMAEDGGYHVPEIDWRRTAQRVLTLARIDGIRIDEREVLIAAGHDIDAVMEKAARAFFNQVFRDGFFHADQHPGNMFVDSAGDIVAVDFGIMGRLDRDTRRYLAEMLLGFLAGNYARVADIHFEAGYVPADQSRAAFTQACRAIGEPILGQPLNEISFAQLLAQLFQVTKTFAMETQPQLLLLQKNMLIAEGTGRRLNPNINLWVLARPLIEDWAVENLGPQARARDIAADALDAARRLPKLVKDAETAFAGMAEGGLKLHPDTVRALAGGKGGNAQLWWAALAAIAVVYLLFT